MTPDNLHKHHKHCIRCSSQRLSPIDKFNHAGLIRCKDCGFVFSKWAPTVSDLNEYYADYPRHPSISEITRARYNEILDMFEAYRELNRILDIGCSSGFFLEEARKRGWDVYGTEVSDVSIENGTSKGFKMLKGKMSEITTQPRFFDAITNFEVIEHINYPNEEAKAIHNALRPGGVLYLTTPNYKALSKTILGKKWNMVEYPEHLSYYTKQSLSELFIENGFKVLSLRTTGISVTRFKESMKGQNHDDISEHPDEKLRSRVERWLILRISKTSANRTLSLLNKGDTLKMLAQKVSN